MAGIKVYLPKFFLKKVDVHPIYKSAHLTQRTEADMVGYGLRPALLFSILT